MSEQDEYNDLTALYSEACQAFVLRDFDTTSSIVDSLLDRIEGNGLGLNAQESESSSSSFQLGELVRRVWILQITLLASSDEELARKPKEAERELAGTLSRIERFYSRQETTAAASTTTAIPSTSSATATSVLIHPSILVAVSLAGLKLEIPSFVRRTLQDYFRLLLSQAASSGAVLSSSQGDLSALDASQADLSLSGIAVHGHNGSTVNGHNGSHNGTSTLKPANTAAGSRIKSLHRLARIYSIHLLGKALGEWSAARAWIREQADDDAAVAAALMDDSYAQSLLETLEETKRQQEEEELEARQAEKQEKERQAELLKKNKQRNTPPSSSQGGKASASTTSNGHAPPLRPERSKDRTQPSERAKHSAQDNASSSSSSSSSLARRDAQERETGFSAFRSHLTNFLSSDSQSSISRGNHHSNSSRDLSRKNSGNNSIDIIKIYLSKIVHSRLLKLLLAFFIITGFWRRRLARSGRNIGIRKTLMRLREKVVETVKMGGSLGFL